MQPVPAGYPIAKLTGPMIVAYFFHWALFGTLSLQLYLYYLAFPKDKKSTKYFVYGIYVAEFAQTMLVAHDAFAVFGYGFGDIEALTRMNSNWLTVPVMSAAAACVAQVFYAYRIFILSKSRIIPIFVTCVSLTSSVAGIITGVYSFQAGNITKLNNRKTSIAVGIWCGASALCDIVIAICMTYYLTCSDTVFRRTRMVVTKLIRLTIETGSVTAVFALLNLILFYAFPHQTFYTTPALLMPKLYANTVYMVLNSRIQINGGRDIYTSSSDMRSITTTLIQDNNLQSTQGTIRNGKQGRAPMVTITKEVFNDDYEMGQMNDKLEEA
ncbi:uncharacterized protein EV420DRAFT_315030 [Desarmillaria tabescens]|uniref:DUF6534 domain-containing protein n=1 Tax=Armillaria tabescens TaxID=1929756 RepID=A0AA39N5Y6_ARMTA|nr:uncharacterized protein EV420DRAFT_315030 [Desarmillaria tabescens]KAK0459316.1 hypothetical protein EV420DRAFT_315030 [Desarmillaria tabescens]